MALRKSSCLIFCLCVCLGAAADVYGAAAVKRREQQQRMMQQMQQQAYQQAMAQRQAQEVAAYQQAVAQRQGMLQQAAYQKAAAEYAAYKQAMQQAVAKRTAELQAAAQIKQQVQARQAQEVAAYQTTMARKQLGEVVANRQSAAVKQAVEQKAQADINQQVREYAQYLAARKAALTEQAAVTQQLALGQQMAQHAAMQHVKNYQTRAALEKKIAVESSAARTAVGQKIAAEVLGAKVAHEAPQAAVADQPETVVGIEDLWKALDVSSEAWDQIVDNEIKLLTVAEYIDRYARMKIKIRKPPGYYVGLIDALALKMAGFLAAPFANILSYTAVMEYDFDNGTDKDELARQMLGAEQFESNRKRVMGQ